MQKQMELQKEIEHVREMLNEEAERNVSGENCYQISVYLDQLIADYITNKKKINRDRS